MPPSLGLKKWVSVNGKTYFKHLKVKVKQSRYRPGVAQRVPES